MNIDAATVRWLAGVGLAALLAVMALRLSRNARIRRRLRKSRSQVVSKTSRPMVKFSVRPPKE
jgi:hypothetical protein